MSETRVRARPDVGTRTTAEPPGADTRAKPDGVTDHVAHGAPGTSRPRHRNRRQDPGERLSLTQRVTRLPVGRKLLLIYTVGIFVPLVLANGLVLRSVLRDARSQQQSYIHAAIENLKNDLIRELEPIEQVSESIFSDETIYTLLARNYTRFVDFMEVHRTYLLPALIRYVNVYPGISHITIYTNNETIGVSTGYVPINPYVRASEWLARFSENNLRMVVMHHVDADPRLEMGAKEYISLFRNLNNAAFEERSQMILRIDITPTVLTRHVADAGFTGRIEIVDPWGVPVIARSNGELVGNTFTFDSPITGSKPLEGWSIRGEIVPFGEPLAWSARWTFLLVVSGLSIAVSSLFILMLSRSVISRLRSLSTQMRKVESEDFSLLPAAGDSQDEVDHLINDFNMMAAKIDSLINDGYKSEIERNRLAMAGQQAELNALQSQVNPHFLYNVLESIRMKSHIRGEHETARVIKLLSHMFRRLASWGDDLITLRDELEFTQEYIEIQQYRFGERLKADFSVDTGITEMLIPKLTVQALVENALVHGIERRTEGGTVWVLVNREDNRLTIRVSDDGVGCNAVEVRRALVAPQTETNRSSTHIGIANLYRRLMLHFGDRFGFAFDSQPGRGTTAEIRIEATDEDPNVADS